MNVILWVAQVLLAATFLLAGLIKATRPIEQLSTRMTWVKDAPPAFVRFVGTAEVLGAIGLILPGVTRILPPLTIAAAIGLAIVMVGAIVLHAKRGPRSTIGGNVVLLALALFVAYGRLVIAPL